jgi:hypothetical protein
MQLRFSSMQVDIFALLTEARAAPRIAARRDRSPSKNSSSPRSELKNRRHMAAVALRRSEETTQHRRRGSSLPMAVTDMEANMFFPP